MHRLAWKRNTFPGALSILNHRISAEVCLLGHQWISRGFTLRKVQYHQYTRSQKIHWTLITQEMRNGLQIDFSRETFFGCFFGTLARNVSIQNPSSKNRSDMALDVPPRAIYHFIFFSLSWNIC